MKSYLYTWNPDKWTWHDQPEAIYQVSNNLEYDTFWSSGNRKHLSIGEMFFLMRLGVEPKGIIGCGYLSSKVYSLPHWDAKKAAEGKTAPRTDLLFKALSDNPIIPIEHLESKYPDFNWTPQSGGTSIPSEISKELLSHILGDDQYRFEEQTEEEVRTYTEGKPKKVTYRSYDRNPAARQDCIKHYGYNCQVCGFNFKKEYGDLGRNYIEVHHLKQVSDIGMEYEINPVDDLRPVCANCHRMLHKKRKALSIEELKGLI